MFDLDLLRSVAATQESRSVLLRPEAIVHVAHVFPLVNLLYCAQCEAEALREEKPELRSRLIGHQKLKQALRYRHSERRRCGSRRQSIQAEDFEGDFSRLIDVLQVHPEAVELIAELAVQSRFSGLKDQDEHELEEQKKIAIAKHRRAPKNNLILFQSGEIEADEYYRQKVHHECQIVYREARITDKQKITLELTTCIEMVRRLKDFWGTSTGEDRKLLAQSLFDEII